MKKPKIRTLRDMVLGSILTLTILFAATQVSALVATRNTTVTFNDIKVYIDGEAVTLKDLDGNAVEPILVFDTLYAPVSPLARAFGKTSTYDGRANAVYIADRPIERSWSTPWQSFTPGTQDQGTIQLWLEDDYLTHNQVRITGRSSDNGPPSGPLNLATSPFFFTWVKADDWENPDVYNNTAARAIFLMNQDNWFIQESDNAAFLSNGTASLTINNALLDRAISSANSLNHTSSERLTGRERSVKSWMDTITIANRSISNKQLIAHALGKTVDDLTDADAQQYYKEVTIERIMAGMGRLVLDDGTVLVGNDAKDGLINVYNEKKLIPGERYYFFVYRYGNGVTYGNSIPYGLSTLYSSYVTLTPNWYEPGGYVTLPLEGQKPIPVG